VPETGKREIGWKAMPEGVNLVIWKTIPEGVRGSGGQCRRGVRGSWFESQYRRG